MLCWHRRARKTTFILNLLIRECIKHPKSVYGLIGPTIAQEKAIVWRDPNMLDRYLPQGLVEDKNESELFVRFTNKSMLRIEGVDKPDRLRGPDWAGIGLDEFSLMKENVWSEILRPVITQSPERWAMFAFTPKGQNHAYEYWQRDMKDWYKSFLPASVSGLFSETELTQAKKETPHSLYMQEYECSFLAPDERSLIGPEDLELLKNVFLHRTKTKKIIACDPSQGGDECVIYVFENEKKIDELIVHHRDTMKIAGELIVMSAKHKIDDFIIDTVGVGAGVADRVAEQGKRVIRFNSGERSSEPKRFTNKKAEMWWYVAEQIRNREVYYPEDPELRRELTAIRYDVRESTGKVCIEDKQKIKQLIGRSPDRADCYAMGIWGLKEINEDTGIVDFNIKRPVFSGAGAW